MSNMECRDIFNAVYTNVRESYIQALYSVKTKTKALTSSVTTETTSNVTKNSELNTQNTTEDRENSNNTNETVTEKIERDQGSEIVAKIRSDIEEKFPFVLASACSNLATIDRAYRKMKGYEEQPEFSEFILETTDEFPLSDRFAFPCIMYVSSMVLIDINEKKSDDFYEKYASSVTQIVSELPCESSAIVEKYPY